MNNILKSAIRKCQHLEGRVWHGYLTPIEILNLNDLGIRCNVDHIHDGIIKHCIMQKRNGIATPSWFYFIANKKFEILKG